MDFLKLILALQLTIFNVSLLSFYTWRLLLAIFSGQSEVIVQFAHIIIFYTRDILFIISEW